MTRKRKAISAGDIKARKACSTNVTKPDTYEKIDVNKAISVPIAKADERIVTGVAMTPDVVDAHGDFFSEETIKKAAHQFLSQFNVVTKMGLQHKHFNKNIELLESSIMRQSTLIGSTVVKKGAWVVTVKVNDDKIWSLIKSGKITGFSIGGRAKARAV